MHTNIHTYIHTYTLHVHSCFRLWNSLIGFKSGVAFLYFLLILMMTNFVACSLGKCMYVCMCMRMCASIIMYTSIYVFVMIIMTVRLLLLS